jgi:hypothetical protein
LQFDQLFNNGETEAGSAIGFGGSLDSLFEILKYLLEVILGNANPRVSY